MIDLCTGVLADVDRALRRETARLSSRGPAPRLLLDVGCWDGVATARYSAILGCAACGIEVFAGPAASARELGIEVAEIDLEREPFPWGDESFDVVVANQVFEHLKNIWLPMSEIFRVMRPGGALILSVPNLASLHNRILLAAGGQPTSIRTLGPHVRGYTRREIRKFVTLGDRFEVVRAFGVGFYPLPARWARPFAALWPGASHTSVIVGRKRAGAGRSPWLARIEDDLASGIQTSYL